MHVNYLGYIIVENVDIFKIFPILPMRTPLLALAGIPNKSLLVFPHGIPATMFHALP